MEALYDNSFEEKYRFKLPTMKEHTYGWYPAMRDIYTERRMGAPTAYELEAMYKYRDSQYYTSPSPPTGELKVYHKPSSQTPTPSKRPGSTMSSRSSNYEQELQVRAKSAPIAAFKPIPKLCLPTPQQCWATKLPETEYGVYQSPTPSVELTPKAIPLSPEVRPTPPPTSPEPASLSRSDSRRERVKSAVIRRDKPTPPPRPVKSAGPSRSACSASTSIQVKDTGRPSSTSSDKYRPVNPVSKININQQSIPEEVLSPDGEYDYDKNLQKYGWRMEVHGDPYKIKKVTKRLPYYVKCSAPDLQDAPPSVHMENRETFFYNTIPRRPAAYAVHKEWISEVIHAKRLELQKREGIKYRWKNFSFVY